MTKNKEPISFHGRPNTSKVWKALCAFEWRGSLFQAQPQSLFRPVGLVIWGAPPMATLEMALVGMQQQLLVSYGKFPARFFALGDNFEQIAKLLEAGKEPPAWADWDTAEVGNTINVVVMSKENVSLGPQDGVEIAMWGKSVRY